MTVKGIDVSGTLERAREAMKKSKDLSSENRALIELLMTIISILVEMMNLNSTNSSVPPSKNPIGAPKPKRTKQKGRGKKLKPGAQKGHKGSYLKPVPDPEEIKIIEIDRRTLPRGEYELDGYETRQVFDVKISRLVTEYRAEILRDREGNKFVADFPDGVSCQAQYGGSVKSQSVYMSVWQLVPQQRVTDFFQSQFGMGVSKGSVANFNKAAYRALEDFEVWAKQELIQSPVNHVDETGLNIDGKNHWLHCVSNSNTALYHVDPKRGKEAMDRMGILPEFIGRLVHDHWKPYFQYNCIHALCNAHHLRELTWAYEVDDKKWAGKMIDLLTELNNQVTKSGGCLSADVYTPYLKRYRSILKAGSKETPLTVKQAGKSGRAKQTKSRNLLDRLKEYEDDVLRFATDKEVPFTNNAGENDIRMTKVQQKISGCFRSLLGAQVFCRVRSFLLTCQKRSLNPFECLTDLFKGKLPEFIE